MILLTNDDGIFAPGLAALRDALSQVDDVVVVAPDIERSGAAHSITVHLPLRVRKINWDQHHLGYAVSGSPADCVKIAVRELLERTPDFVISGINYGGNVGINVLYSGTVAGALEGAMFALPSMACSLEYTEEANFHAAAEIVCKIYAHFKQREIPPGTLLNVNIPAIPPDRLKGVRITRMSRSVYNEKFDKRYDPRGDAYYWIDGYFKDTDSVEGTDAYAVANGYVSVTPLHYDLTDYKLLQALGGAGSEAENVL